LIDAGRFDEGIAECESALRIDPDFPEAHHNLGIAYARSGRMELAIPEFEKAVLLRPDEAIYRHNLERARAAR
jgi:Flp pilus assembly protein TadD